MNVDGQVLPEDQPLLTADAWRSTIAGSIENLNILATDETVRDDVREVVGSVLEDLRKVAADFEQFRDRAEHSGALAGYELKSIEARDVRPNETVGNRSHQAGVTTSELRAKLESLLQDASDSLEALADDSGIRDDDRGVFELEIENILVTKERLEFLQRQVGMDGFTEALRFKGIEKRSTKND